MNRTGLCIRMLQLLQARGKLNTKELADLLETNPRNIREYKKELVLAGYNIQEKKGRYGGYYLDDSYALPVYDLNEDEKTALNRSFQYMQTQKEFSDQKAYTSAMDKILSNQAIKHDATHYYLSNRVIDVDENMNKMIDEAQRAIKDGHCLYLEYQPIHKNEINTYTVEPYEIIHYSKSYYLIGFCLERNDYRLYRFSNQRMFKCEYLSRLFLRDRSFQLKNYIGEHNLISSDFKEIHVRVFKSGLRIFKEMYWGNQLTELDIQMDYTDFSFYTDDMYHLFRNLFNLTEHAEVLYPSEVREEFITRLKTILHTYIK